MQLTTYERLLAREMREKKVTVHTPSSRPVLEGGKVVRFENFTVESEELVNDVNEVYVRVFLQDQGYLIRLDSSGEGEGVGWIAFTRYLEEALNFALKVTLEEARGLFKLHRQLEGLVTRVASKAVTGSSIEVGQLTEPKEAQ